MLQLQGIYRRELERVEEESLVLSINSDLRYHRERYLHLFSGGVQLGSAHCGLLDLQPLVYSFQVLLDL